MNREFSTNQIATIAGVSVRQLQWWDEKEIVSPRHEGHRRFYSVGAAIQASLIAMLKTRGFTLPIIRPLLRSLTNHWDEFMKARFMVTDGRWLRLVSAAELTQCVLEAGRPVVVIDLTELRATINAFH